MKSLNILYNKVKANILLSLTYSLLPLGFIFTSCESREQLSYGEDATPLSSAVVTVSDAQYNSLTFKWEPVADAVEYGYTLTDEDDNVIDGGLTKVDSVKFEDLTHSTNYTFHLYAYASVMGEKTTSAESTLPVTTPFWPVVNESGTYTSAVVTGTTSWTATLVEERESGKDDEFGTFTLEGWYNHSGYDMKFTVNKDNTIKVLNGTEDPTTGYVNVAAGANTIKTNQYVRNGVLIDETRSTFDRENQTLSIYTFSTKAGSSLEGYDTFEW